MAALFAILALLGAIALSGCKPSGQGPSSPLAGRGGAGQAGQAGQGAGAGGAGGGMRGGGGGGGMRGGGMGGGGRGMRGGGGGGGGGMRGAGMRGGGMGGGGMQGGGAMGGDTGEAAPAEVVAPVVPAISEQEVRVFVNDAAVQANVKLSGKVRNELEASLASPPTSDQLAAALKKEKEARPELVGILAKAMKDQGTKLQTEEQEKAVALAIWLTDALTGRLIELTSAGEEGLAAVPDIEKLKLIQQFAALYGPVVWVKEKNWDGRIIDWVTFTHKSQGVKLPVSMIYDASTIQKKPWLQLLEGYFGIYSTGLGFGEVASKQGVTASAELKAKVIAEQKKLAEEMNKPVVVVAAAEGEEAAGGAGGGAGMGGGGGRGMRGGGGGGGMRGGGGGGMRGGGGGGMRGGGGGGMRGGGGGGMRGGRGMRGG
jgi:hypothetical protein